MWTFVTPFPCSGLVIAMVVSLIFIVLLRFLAGIMVWVMMFMVILVILYGKLKFPSKISETKVWLLIRNMHGITR